MYISRHPGTMAKFKTLVEKENTCYLSTQIEYPQYLRHENTILCKKTGP
jgi:hypothetical protein